MMAIWDASTFPPNKKLNIFLWHNFMLIFMMSRERLLRLGVDFSLSSSKAPEQINLR
jgi:hypothetical protein